MNILTLSTLPHFLAIVPLINTYSLYKGYITTIFLSSSLSVLYHTFSDVEPMIVFADYLAAFIWGVYDLRLGVRAGRTMLRKAIYLNLVILLLNIVSHNTNNYELAHSCWHILSATKCYYISYYISRIYGVPALSWLPAYGGPPAPPPPGSSPLGVSMV
jgi:hypothetical protein